MTLEQARALPELENGAGVYFLWRGEELLYVGASTDCSQRIARHMQTQRYGKLAVYDRKNIPFDRGTILKADRRQCFEMEEDFIRRFEPPYNVPGSWGHRWCG